MFGAVFLDRNTFAASEAYGSICLAAEFGLEVLTTRSTRESVWCLCEAPFLHRDPFVASKALGNQYIAAHLLQALTTRDI